MTIALAQWQLDKASKESFSSQLYLQAQQAIQSGRWVAGARLPSIRLLAAHLEISKFTVSELYEKLSAAGFVRSQPGSGVYVSRLTEQQQQLESSASQSSRQQDVALMRQTLLREPHWIKASAGWLSPDWMPDQEIRQAMRDLARQPQSLTDYGPAQGYFPLRQYFTQRLSQLSIATEPAHILLTYSASHALDLVFRLHLKPGDWVMVDDPGFYNFFALLRLHQVQLLVVPRTKEGPDLAVMQQLVQQYQPKAYLTNSVLSNPVSLSIHPARAFAVLQLLQQYQCLLIEDDIYADFETQPVSRYASMAGFQSNNGFETIYLGSMSKTLSADLRVGFIAAAPATIAALTDLKLISGISTSNTMERLVYALLTGGGYRRHLEQLKRRLQQARSLVFSKLKQLDCQLWVEPSAGFLCWVKLPEGVSSSLLSERLHQRQIVLAPGSQFSTLPDADQYTRLNVAQCLDEQFWLILAEELRQIRDSISLSSNTSHDGRG